MSDSDNEPATKDDLRAVRVDTTALREEIRALFQPITIALANHTAMLADIRGHLKDNMVTRDEFHSRMDDLDRALEAKNS